MTDEIERLKRKIERLSAWIEGDCTCPCCERTRVCADGCTFETDAPQDAERMEAARQVLYGGAR